MSARLSNPGSRFNEISAQTASATIAQKALAYGFPGVLVDGNDIFAVYAVTREAVERARSGKGPSLIEAYTYRLGAHTTADDPSKYRDSAELAEWQPRALQDRSPNSRGSRHRPL